MHDEVEVKFLEIDAEAIDRRLRAFGAVLEYDSVLENVYFSRTEALSKPGDSAQPEVRLRTRDGKTTLTYKSPAIGATRKESEVGVEDAATMQEILESLGYKMIKRVSKRRRHFVKGDVHFEIDEFGTIPPLLEIEARSLDAIQETCKQLGLDYSLAQTGTVADLYNLP